ncbi:MAG: deoxyguanosinetriphosphate triphosphohydrolase [Chthoniobacteraceae bacterium]
MIRTREELEVQERVALASYAQKSGDSEGRIFPEPRHPHRTDYQRDRARVIHSRAFRRLEYKTQVFLNGTGDHLRTRLTHTFEVANITRTVARALGLNEDLAEAIALAHDLGHPPFGHTGEETLDALMRKRGGFDHNEQSLRIVDVIELRYPKFPGLNLSHEVREGLQKHARFYESAKPGGKRTAHPSLEAQVANLADEITYYSHDLDDGLDFKLLEPKQLAALEAWRGTEEQVRSDFPALKGAEFRAYVIRCLIDRQVADVIRTSSARIDAAGVRSADDVRGHREPLIAYSPELRRANVQLRKFLYKNLYYHPRVAGANKAACEMLGDVFGAYLKKPELLGEATARRVDEVGLHRTVCDYVSGMTDRYLLDEHARLFKKTRKPAPKRAVKSAQQPSRKRAAS